MLDGLGLAGQKPHSVENLGLVETFPVALVIGECSWHLIGERGRGDRSKNSFSRIHRAVPMTKACCAKMKIAQHF